jgi:hypothetical protein
VFVREESKIGGNVVIEREEKGRRGSGESSGYSAYWKRVRKERRCGSRKDQPRWG